MSLILSKSGEISCKIESTSRGTGILHGNVSIGNYDIDIEDFYELVKYVLTNTDLSEYDTRKDFVNWVHSLEEVPGWNNGNTRYGVLF